MAWRRTTRKINGKVRAVKVHRKGDGNELVRVIGKRSYSDRTRVHRTTKKRRKR